MSQEVCLHVQILIEAEKYMRRKWGGHNGEEMEEGKMREGSGCGRQGANVPGYDGTRVQPVS